MTSKRCIIGCGTYGSYLLRRLIEAFPDDEIIVLELGDRRSQSESEAGLYSESMESQAARAGRYFGLGGTSARWGGQVLFFDERDNPLHDPVWSQIIAINKRYKTRVIENLFGDRSIQPLLELNDKGNLKTGIWLKYNKRNLFKQVNLYKKSEIQLRTGCRVISMNFTQDKLQSVEIINEQRIRQIIEADIFYLTAGAIESCRIMLEMRSKGKFTGTSDIGKHLGDHLSVELFKIQNSTPAIQGVNLIPIWHKGSLVTKRLLVYTSDGRVGYIQGVFNKHIRIFTILKQLMFGKKQTEFNIKELFTGLVFLLKLAWNLLIKRQLYADPKEWSLQLDIEQQYPNKHKLELSKTNDKFGVPGIKLDWSAEPEDRKFIEEISLQFREILLQEKLQFSDCFNNVVNGATKIEDVYHPVGFMRMGTDDSAVTDMHCKIRGAANLFHFSTALFSSARSINPTGAVFCLIEAHLEQAIQQKTA